MPFFGPFGGGGGAAATYNQHTIADEYVGPSSYPTGGFVIDLTPTYSSLNSLDLVVKKGSRGANLPAVMYEITLNSPANGKATVKVMRKRYERTTSVGNSANAPVGVTIQTVSGQSSTAGTSHTHDYDHDHAPVTSSGPTNSGAAVLLNALGPNHSTHTHVFDMAFHLGLVTGTESAHTHVDNTVYQHGHDVTYTTNNVIQSELSNATNLSGTTWYICATGVKA